MSTVPLVLLASARKASDTRKLVDLVFQSQPHQVVDLLDYVISPYRYENDYPPQDGFLEIMAKVLEHEVIVLATPVYWYAMSGLLKTFFDRLTDVVTVQKNIGRRLKGKVIFCLAVGTDSDVPEGFEVPFVLAAKYLELHYGGCLYASTEDLGHPDLITKRSKSFLNNLEQYG